MCLNVTDDPGEVENRALVYYEDGYLDLESNMEHGWFECPTLQPYYPDRNRNWQFWYPDFNGYFDTIGILDVLPEPIDCIWSDWSPWGSCDQPCNASDTTNIGMVARWLQPNF